MNVLKNFPEKSLLALVLAGFVMLVSSCGEDDSSSLPAVVAKFSGVPTSVKESETVSFKDESSNAPTEWLWTFEGGTPATSTEKDPVVTYSSAGTYDVTLVATRATDKSTSTKKETDYITVEATTPVGVSALFSASAETIEAGGEVTFANNSTGADKWEWTFEGGTPTTSTEKNPKVTYATAGDYTVTLVATSSDNGTSTKTMDDFIKVLPAGSVLAAFSATSLTLVSGKTVTFTDESTNTPDQWSWEFEGGTPATSNEQNPTVTYSEEGSYTVKLTATRSSDANSNEIAKASYITVVGPGVQFPYRGIAQVIPGKIDVAFFDEGGEGVAFHDMEEANKTNGKGPRADTPVEIEVGDSVAGIYNHGFFDGGEWIEFTVDVATTGSYTAEFILATNGKDPKVQLQNEDGTPFGGASEILVISNGGWQIYSSYFVENIWLEAGVKVMRYASVGLGGTNTRSITFTLDQ